MVPASLQHVKTAAVTTPRRTASPLVAKVVNTAQAATSSRLDSLKQRLADAAPKTPSARIVPDEENVGAIHKTPLAQGQKTPGAVAAAQAAAGGAGLASIRQRIAALQNAMQ